MNDRMRHLDVSWNDYVIERQRRKEEKEMTKHLLSLRSKIIDFIKKNSIKLTDNCANGRLIRERLTRNIDKSAYVLVPPKLRAFLSASSSMRDENGKKIRNIETFILDVGSKRDTSNSDLTVINAPGPQIIDDIIDLLNDAFYPRLRRTLSQADLDQVFDIHLYVNSFLVLIDGNFWYVDVRKIEHYDNNAAVQQRKHATSRIFRKYRKYRPRSASCYKDQINRLMKRKTTAFMNNDVSAVLDLTSQLAGLTSTDAYRSQGAFLHVLLEIQTGTDLFLTTSQYMDSAYDNLGMVIASTCKKTERIEAHDFSKYVSRLTHALLQVRRSSSSSRSNEKKKKEEQRAELDILIDEVVAYFDSVSEMDASKERLSCSTGLISAIRTVPNVSAANFVSILSKRHRGCHYFTPFRKLVAVSPASFIKFTKYALDEIDRLISNR